MANDRAFGTLFQSGERVLLALWVGSLWSIGYLAVPVLFSSLDDRILAGMLAGKMFTAVSFIGIGCGSAVLAFWWMRFDRPLSLRRVQLLLLMLLLVLVGEFALQPQMAALKQSGLVEGSEAAARFGTLHGIASLLYMVNALIGIVLVSLLGVAPGSRLRAGG